MSSRSRSAMSSWRCLFFWNRARMFPPPWKRRMRRLSSAAPLAAGAGSLMVSRDGSEGGMRSRAPLRVAAIDCQVNNVRACGSRRLQPAVNRPQAEACDYNESDIIYLTVNNHSAPSCRCAAPLRRPVQHNRSAQHRDNHCRRGIARNAVPRRASIQATRSRCPSKYWGMARSQRHDLMKDRRGRDA